MVGSFLATMQRWPLIRPPSGTSSSLHDQPAAVDICRDRAERHTASAETIERKNARLANSSASRQLDDDITPTSRSVDNSDLSVRTSWTCFDHSVERCERMVRRRHHQKADLRQPVAEHGRRQERQRSDFTIIRRSPTNSAPSSTIACPGCSRSAAISVASL
jgi:hypothetical protein